MSNVEMKDSPYYNNYHLERRPLHSRPKKAQNEWEKQRKLMVGSEDIDYFWNWVAETSQNKSLHSKSSEIDGYFDVSVAPQTFQKSKIYLQSISPEHIENLLSVNNFWLWGPNSNYGTFFKSLPYFL